MRKQLSDHWMLYASYLYSTLQGNYDGAFRAIGGFFAKDPNITDDFDYPDFQVNAYGRLTLDRTHQAKLQTAYVFPFGLTRSKLSTYESAAMLSCPGWMNCSTSRNTRGFVVSVYQEALRSGRTAYVREAGSCSASRTWVEIWLYCV